MSPGEHSLPLRCHEEQQQELRGTGLSSAGEAVPELRLTHPLLWPIDESPERLRGNAEPPAPGLLLGPSTSSQPQRDDSEAQPSPGSWCPTVLGGPGAHHSVTPEAPRPIAWSGALSTSSHPSSDGNSGSVFCTDSVRYTNCVFSSSAQPGVSPFPGPVPICSGGEEEEGRTPQGMAAPWWHGRAVSLCRWHCRVGVWVVTLLWGLSLCRQ